LFLYVRVRENWADDPERRREMGWSRPRRSSLSPFPRMGDRSMRNLATPALRSVAILVVVTMATLFVAARTPLREKRSAKIPS
jgi:hypothetical protein